MILDYHGSTLFEVPSLFNVHPPSPPPFLLHFSLHSSIHLSNADTRSIRSLLFTLLLELHLGSSAFAYDTPSSFHWGFPLIWGNNKVETEHSADNKIIMFIVSLLWEQLERIPFCSSHSLHNFLCWALVWKVLRSRMTAGEYKNAYLLLDGSANVNPVGPISGSTKRTWL